MAKIRSTKKLKLGQIKTFKHKGGSSIRPPILFHSAGFQAGNSNHGGNIRSDQTLQTASNVNQFTQRKVKVRKP